MGRTNQREERATLILGTRGSALARRQAEGCRALLQYAHPEVAIGVEVIKSLGDQEPDKPLRALGAQGIFTAALEGALAEGAIDVAVHSAKDLPSTLAAGFVIAATPACADRRDCLLTRDGLALEQLPNGATVGTGSPRRAAQLRAIRPDVVFTALRGNVDTRRRAVLDGRIDAAVLAVAGLSRLGLLDHHVTILPVDVCLPQAGQGILALETRAADQATRELLRAVDDPELGVVLNAERAVLAGLGAGCQAPVAAHAYVHDRTALSVTAVIAGANPGDIVRVRREGHVAEAQALGRAVAEELRARGADALLLSAREAIP